jgi:hypothetical protein
VPLNARADTVVAPAARTQIDAWCAEACAQMRSAGIVGAIGARDTFVAPCMRVSE